MVPADNLTYATIERSVLDLAKNYGFTHCDTSAVECLTSAVFHYMQQVSTDTKYSAELAGRSTACSSDVILSAKNNRLDVETLNQYMIWNEPIKTSTELPQYPVILPERPESPISDNELKEREEKDIPKFAPSIRIKPKVKKLPEEPVEEEEEENIDELTLAAMKISSSIKPITHASKNVDDFDRLNLVLSETLPNFDHYSGKYEHEIDFLGSSAAAQEAAAANAAVKEQMRLEEEEHRQKILEQEKLQYQESQYYQQPEEPMIDFEDDRQQKMVEFSKQFIPELTKPEIQKEEEEKHLRIESPIISTLAEDLYVSPSPSPPPEEKPSYSQEPPPLKPISSPIHSEPIPSTTVHPTSINDQNGNPIPINDIKNENSDIKNVEKEKHKKKHKHHKEKRREKEKKKEEEAERQREEEKKNKKDKHKEKKKEKKKEREKEKDNEKEKERGKHREKVKEQPPLLLPLQPPKLQPPSKITTNMSQNIAPESVIKASSTLIIPKKSEKEQKKKEKKSKDLKPLKEPEILPMEKLKPPSLKFRFPQSDKSVPSRPPPPPPIEPSATITPNLANISGSSTSSKGSTKAQPSYKSSADESRPHKKIKDKEKGSEKEKEKERDKEKEKEKEKDKSLKRKHKDEPVIIMTPNMKVSMKNDGEKEHKIPKLEKQMKRDKDKKEKDRTNETPQEREERKRLKKEKKKREKEKRKRKLEPSSNDNNSGEPEQKKQKISERQPPPLPPSQNKSIKIKISLPIRPPPPPTAAAPPPPILAPAIPSLPIPTKVENVSKPPALQSVAKSVPQSFSPKLPPPTSTSKTSTTNSKSTSSSKRPSSSKSSSSSSRNHSSKKDKDETYRSSNTESTLNAPKIMSERQQMSKALKESMQTANLTPSSSSLSRSDRHSYEQRKKKRPDKEKAAGEKSKNGNLSLPSSLGHSAPSLPPELPPSQTGLPSNESPPKLEISAPTAENAEKANDDEEVYSWCPNCGIRYVDGDNMVCCDQCHYWYHWSCVGFYSEPQEDKWFCFKCTDVVDKESVAKSTSTKVD